MVKRVTALLLGLAFAVLLLECGLRLLAALGPRGDTVELRQIPGAAPIVSTWPQEMPDPAFKILVVGDSFTLGRGVRLDEVYAARLAAKLGGDGHRIQVTSYSFPGWNSRTEAAALARDLDKYAPHLLVIGHCLNDAERQPTARATADRPELRPWQPTGRLETLLDRSSVLFARVRRAIDTLRLRPLLRDYYQALYRDEDGRELWTQALAKLRGLAAERSIPAALIVFPIFDSELDEEYPYRNLHALVEETGNRLGFEVLDLLPAYAGIDGRELALIPFTDPHPSVLGHEIAARELARFLEEEDLLTTGEAAAE